ncbi:zinc-binding dehydrogenase [Streptomyces sp. NPDC097617]|uniref:zinc-binding dehydrogenase n=1 Tax=Streptomyces sp. NPDC097617 TaxID=3366091 RepID=UPI0038047AB7
MSEQTVLAAVVSGFGGPEQVALAEVPAPRPAAGQLRVKVTAAGLNPVDGAVRAGVFGGAVRDGGVYVGLIPHHAPVAERGIRVEEQEVAADGAHLARLVALADAGELTLRVAETFPLAEVAKAHDRLGTPGVRGRIILTV